ncbi:hypothetical protein MCOR10_003667 [Pyricularia oryzae]|nr:hypothetical protein MCOR10_003667 [Pyricularia oryzae]
MRSYSSRLLFAWAVVPALVARANPIVLGRTEALVAAHVAPRSLAIQGPVLTSKWFEGSDYVQVVEMVLRNTDNVNAFIAADKLTITAVSDSVELVQPALVRRIMPGQEVVVQIGVKNKPTTPRGTSCSVTIQASWGESLSTSTTASGVCGFGDYAADRTSLSRHWTPDWYNNAKFGIFIHWGIYSVPAFGNTGSRQDYAEWYWKRQHEPDYRSQTYQYHLETYGPDVEYDDFIANFTADKFDPKEWLDLFAEAGARYFVPVTKHHDGFALFDTPPATSLRNSVRLGPKRDFIKELFDAAKKYHPTMRRGTYFSLPEWYHPQYAQYGIEWGGGFPGGPPTNPYKNEVVPYTGYVPIDDFVVDLQLPQMNTIAYDDRYETELMWCDIGNANNSTLFASAWINWARDRGRQVTFNDRCGIPGDFATPEYFTHDGLVIPKWESSRGMDPFSYGYNRPTPDAAYLTGLDIVKSLVDIVSKNGNLLLDVGPRADGTIPEVMRRGLRDAGGWIRSHAEAVFDTRFWQHGPGRDPFRYTVTDDAFYVHVNARPAGGGAVLVVPDRVPFLDGDKVVVVGGALAGTEVPAALNADGTVGLSLSDEVVAADDYVWVFKIQYNL